MYNFGSFLQDLSETTSIKFNIFGEEGNPIFAGSANLRASEEIQVPLILGKSKAFISFSKEYEACTSLLKYTIENKYKEMYSSGEQFLINTLEGKELPLDKLEKNFSFLSKGCTLFLIYVDGSKYEALSIVKQLYGDQEVISMLYGDNILVIGAFDEISEHAKSIRESIISDLYCRCYISYDNVVQDIKDIKKAYDNAKECMMLGLKFDIRKEIFNYNKMLFEKIVYNIDYRVKQELLQSFREKFNLFDNEMITTIEEFVNCGLNISDAARRLYVHRNTLIYRLDKIYKETEFDIRNFKEATVFIIAFLVWKESRQ